MMENNVDINYDELDVFKFNVSSEEINSRLDKFLSLKFSDLSRSYIQSLIKENYVFVNDKIEKSSYKVLENDLIVIYFKPVEDLKIEPENIPLDIVYQDEDICVINKKAGIVVHPSAGHRNNTLVNAILYHIKDLSSINGITRPGIVHRLDKDTSGLMVVAKNDAAHRFLAEQLKDHSMARTYVCIVKGVMESHKGIIKTLIGRDKADRLKNAVVRENGKEAITEFEVLKTIGSSYSLVECHLKTGRTHQIRVHMNFIKHPIINDPLYGVNNHIEYDCKQLLHAKKLTLIHPTSKKVMTFEVDMPNYFKDVLEVLER